MTKPSLSILVLAALVLAGCGRHGGIAPDADLPRVAVRAAAVEQSGTPLTQVVSGTVVPQARATVAAKLLASVASADFAVGQRVQAGDLLVKLSAAEIAARVDQAQAALSQAQRDYDREAAFEAKGASTADTVHSLDERRRIAEAGLLEAKSMLGYTDVKAPFSGVVVRKFVNAGDLAAPGTPLFSIEGEDRLRAEVQVPESLPALAPGDAVFVESGAKVVKGSVAEYSPAADPQTRTRLAKIDLPADAALRSGQFVRALWPAGEGRTLVAPASAVSLFGQMERVFAVTDGKARLRLVKTGARAGDSVQILSGLDAGEKVVLSPPATLRDGQPLEVQP
ncbi:efflux RND transporter periplasmic adaptor subunit [Opitutaceae bacterium EW11]|nr:efflux RND transporter periplasmic adaptor subunit [Opitutaceae bacterium EW11]